MKLKLGFWTLELKQKKIKSNDEIDEEVIEMNQKIALLT